MKKEYHEDTDIMLWDALDKAFWRYAVQLRGSGLAATDKLAAEVRAYLCYLRDQELCYDDK